MKTKKKLKDFLTGMAKDAQIKSLTETPDNKYEVKVSAYNALVERVYWLIELLDDIYEIEEDDDEVTLIKKKIIK